MLSSLAKLLIKQTTASNSPSFSQQGSYKVSVPQVHLKSSSRSPEASGLDPISGRHHLAAPKLRQTSGGGLPSFPFCAQDALRLSSPLCQCQAAHRHLQPGASHWWSQPTLSTRNTHTIIT